MAGSSSRYFWKEIFAKFARKPLKRCKLKICSSAVCSVNSVPLPRDTWNLAWPCVKQRQHLLLQGLHPSRAGRRWFSGGPQVGEDSGRRGSWMPAQSRSPGQVATPCPSGRQAQAVPTPPSHGRHTADLCQRPCRPAPR